MKLYVMPNACSLAPHIALAWANAACRIVRVDHIDIKRRDYLALNPKGTVPTLVLDDGSSITEALSALKFISNRFPEAELGASSNDLLATARLDDVLADLVTDVHGAWAPVFTPSRYVTKPEDEADAKRAAFGRVHSQYERLDGFMAARTWMLFDHRTVADAYLYVMCRWVEKAPRPLSDYPNLAAFKARLDQDDGVLRALDEEQA